MLMHVIDKMWEIENNEIQSHLNYNEQNILFEKPLWEKI